MNTRIVPSTILLSLCLIGTGLTGCASKQGGTSTLTEKDRASFRGGPMPANARQEMAKWIQKSQAKQKKTGTGPTAAEAAAAAMK